MACRSHTVNFATSIVDFHIVDFRFLVVGLAFLTVRTLRPVGGINLHVAFLGFLVVAGLAFFHCEIFATSGLYQISRCVLGFLVVVGLSFFHCQNRASSKWY